MSVKGKGSKMVLSLGRMNQSVQMKLFPSKAKLNNNKHNDDKEEQEEKAPISSTKQGSKPSNITPLKNDNNQNKLNGKTKKAEKKKS